MRIFIIFILAFITTGCHESQETHCRADGEIAEAAMAARMAGNTEINLNDAQPWHGLHEVFSDPIMSPPFYGERYYRLCMMGIVK